MVSPTDLVLDFVKRHGVHIVSDGDLDGIFASALLVKALMKLGVDIIDLRETVKFPHPRTLKGLEVKSCILIELPPSKGLVYCGENLLIDHHPEPPRIELYSESEVSLRLVIEGPRSAASLVGEIFSSVLSLPSEAKDVIKAVDDADNLTYTTDLSRLLHAAYQLHVTEPEMRYMLLTLAVEDKWNDIISWAQREGKAYLDVVPRKIEELVSRTEEILPSVALFTYDADDRLEKAAVTEAMRRLEEKYDVVVALGLSRGAPDAARIATMRDIDLTQVFSWIIREHGGRGVTAGGRKNVGGVQFRGSDVRTVNQAIDLIRRAIKHVLKR